MRGSRVCKAIKNDYGENNINDNNVDDNNTDNKAGL